MDALRITGIASGMDTEGMVQKLMQAEHQKVDKMYQEKQIDTWRQEQYNDVNKLMANFILESTKEFGVRRSSYGSMMDGYGSMDWVKKATSSEEGVLSASCTAKAMPGNHTINVAQIAQGVSVASGGEVQTTTSLKATESTKLSEVGVTSDGKITFQIKVENPTTKNMEDVEVTVKYKAEDTISDLVDKINSAKTDDGKHSLGLQANFDAHTGRFFLGTKETGSNAQIKIIDDDQNLLADDPSKSVLGKFKLGISLNTTYQGKDAKIDIDGAKDLTYSSNQITINGIQLDLKSVSSKPVSVKVDTDVDGIYDKIKSFIDKYNEMIDGLNLQLTQKRYRDFPPLNEEQKKEMKEEDIKLWEAKAKSGLLRQDDRVSSVLQNMRSGLYEPVVGAGGMFDHLTEIGITTDTWKNKGKLVISDDAEKGLKAAIQKDPDGVLELLFKPSSITKSDSSLSKDERSQKRAESGIFNRLFDDMVTGMKSIINKAGTGDNENLYRDVKANMLIDFVTNQSSISMMDDDMDDLEKRIKREEDRLASVEESYWRKFSAMEKALSQMNQQSQWLAGQMGGM